MVQFSILWTLGWGGAGKQATWGSGARRTAGLRQSLKGDAGARQVALGQGGRSRHEWSTEAQASVGTSRRMDRAEPAWTTPHCTPGKLEQLPTIPPILAPHPSSVSAPLCALHEAGTTPPVPMPQSPTLASCLQPAAGCWLFPIIGR